MPRRLGHAIPQNPCGQTWHEVKGALFAMAEEAGLDVPVRPPLVYRPGVEANFATLMGAPQRRLPLPFAATSLGVTLRFFLASQDMA